MYSQKKMKEYKYWTEIDDDYITYRALFCMCVCAFVMPIEKIVPNRLHLQNCITIHVVINGYFCWLVQFNKKRCGRIRQSRWISRLSMTIFRNGNHDVALIPFAQAILFIFIRVSLPPPPLSHRFWDFPFFFHFFCCYTVLLNLSWWQQRGENVRHYPAVWWQWAGPASYYFYFL